MSITGISVNEKNCRFCHNYNTITRYCLSIYVNNRKFVGENAHRRHTYEQILLWLSCKFPPELVLFWLFTVACDIPACIFKTSFISYSCEASKFFFFVCLWVSPLSIWLTIYLLCSVNFEITYQLFFHFSLFLIFKIIWPTHNSKFEIFFLLMLKTVFILETPSRFRNCPR